MPEDNMEGGAPTEGSGNAAPAVEKKNLVVHTDDAAFVKTSNDVSSTLKILSDSFKGHLDQAMAEMKDQRKHDMASILAVMQQESAKRSALEQRLHSQLLLQNEYMVAMELKLLRLEAKVERREAAIHQQQQHNQQQQQQQRSYPYSVNRLPSTFTTINESALEMPPPAHQTTNNNSVAEETPPNMAVISSGASLASGVTAGSFLGEDGDEEAHHDDRSESRSDTLASDSGNPVTRVIDEDNERNSEDDNIHAASQQSTPTQGSRPRVAVGENGTNHNLESILLNPMIGESNFLQGLSVRATRGPQDTDGNSSLATSVTNSTVITSFTSTTRGDLSTINVRRVLPEEQSEVDILTPSRRGRSTFTDEALNPREESGAQSPLTVATHASETLSMASASTVGTSIRSSVAVAPRSGFGRRAIVPPALAVAAESRPLADRVVSFTPDLNPPPPYSAEAADSITMPDELDNISEVADTFATTASAWREEYEARLDALHKRWSNE